MAQDTIDIEQLLFWAYAEQCVDREIKRLLPKGPSASPANALAQYIELGTRVDGTSFAALTLSSRLPEDAVIVHDTILSLDDFWIEWLDEDQFVVWDQMRAQDKGFSIEKRHGRWWLYKTHSEATEIRVPIRLEQLGISALLIIHAKRGTRPECHLDWKAPRGRPPVGRTLGYSTKKCPHKGSALAFEEVIHARALYLTWHIALQALAEMLDGCLRKYRITGPRAPATPWICAKGAVLKSLEQKNISQLIY